MVKIVRLKIFFKAIICCFCLFLVSCSDAEDSKTKPTKPKFSLVKTPEVNKDSVFYFVQKQVDFGPRIPNSVAHENCADWMVEKLKSYNFKIIEQKGMQLAYDGKELSYRNIIGRFGLNKKKRILLSAHWDTRPWADQDVERTDEPIDGANDAGSGVAVILEVARLLNQKSPNIGVDVVLFDIEDYGKSNETFCYGSKIWSKDTRLDSLIPMYGINLDMVGDPNALFLYEGYSQKYARPILDKVWNIAKHMGYGRYFKVIPDGQITDDHYYVNQAGIPCIDIIHRNPQKGSFADSWHTHNDNMENISSKTLRTVTEVVLQTIYREN
tara:strand:- start:11870 stop:12847 length:978 start_codon:yes stop_codon:yes gene_type:complete